MSTEDISTLFTRNESAPRHPVFFGVPGQSPTVSRTVKVFVKVVYIYISCPMTEIATETLLVLLVLGRFQKELHIMI